MLLLYDKRIILILLLKASISPIPNSPPYNICSFQLMCFLEGGKQRHASCVSSMPNRPGLFSVDSKLAPWSE